MFVHVWKLLVLHEVDDHVKGWNEWRQCFQFCHPDGEMLRFFKAVQNKIEFVLTIMVELNRFRGSTWGHCGYSVTYKLPLILKCQAGGCSLNVCWG